MFGNSPNKLLSELEEARKAVYMTSGPCYLGNILLDAHTALSEANETAAILPELVNELKRWPTNEEIQTRVQYKRDKAHNEASKAWK